MNTARWTSIAGAGLLLTGAGLSEKAPAQDVGVTRELVGQKAVEVVTKTPEVIFRDAKRIDFDSIGYTDILVACQRTCNQEGEAGNFQLRNIQYNAETDTIMVMYYDPSVAITSEGGEFCMTKFDTYRKGEDGIFRFDETSFGASNSYFSIDNLRIASTTREKAVVFIDRVIRTSKTSANGLESKIFGKFTKEGLQK